MQHYAAFHLGLHCLPKYPFRGLLVYKGLKQSSGTEIHLNLEILNCGPLIYTMDHAKFKVPIQTEESIRIGKVK